MTDPIKALIAAFDAVHDAYIESDFIDKVMEKHFKAGFEAIAAIAAAEARPEPAAEPIEGMPYQEAIEGARVATKMMTKMHPPNLQAFDIWVMDAVTYLRDAVEALAREVRR